MGLCRPLSKAILRRVGDSSCEGIKQFRWRFPSLSERPVEEVFNLRALIFGAATMLVCLIVQASGAHIVTQKLKTIIGRYETAHHHYRAQLVFLASALILLAFHLLQIYIWGMALVWSGAEKNAHQAMVFAGSTYTTVGFANDQLPYSWQLVTIIMATSGLFSFGWSTSVMFLLAQTLYPSQR